MSSNLSDRSDRENQKNLERFSPLLYQLKKSGDSSSMIHSMKCDIIGQEPGAYPYPSNTTRTSPNSITEESEEITIDISGPVCFKPKRLL